MTKFMKRGLALMLVVASLVCMIATVGVNASAADFSYVYNGKYIYNWGERGVVATFLSPNAESFYEENNTSYGILSSYSGGTGTSDAPKSRLYSELQSLMKNNHSYITSYNATRDLFKYTDCQNNGGKISSFYSGTLIGPAWGEGSWNREHTWPNSKGLGGSDEDDIMMLRPTSMSENSSRGNTAYGQSSGYYNPNSESGGKYDLRGDVARIFLYVYVRWGNTSYAWGKSGVMESLDVMLEWMEADPVDTWELGRNDSVESITGTRNVFVDYPELGFLLFGEDVPAGMQTPSSESSKDCGHNNYDNGTIVAATCTEKGYTLYTCKTAGCTGNYKDNVTEAKGHSYSSVVTAPTCTKGGYTTYICTVCQDNYVGNKVGVIAHTFVDGKCTACGSEKGSVIEGEISFSTTANRTVFNTSQQVWVQNGITVTNNKSASNVSVADYCNPARFYANSSLIITAEGNITKIVFDCNSSSYANALVESIGSGASASGDKVTVTLDGESDTFTISKLSAQVRIDSITVTCASVVAPCQHTNKTVDQAVAATCTATGLTEGERCADCGEILVAQTTIDALGHDWIPADYENPKTCDRCGATEGEKLPSETPCEHDYATNVTAPTCTDEGFTTYTCVLCGYYYVGDSVAAMGHSYGEEVTDPTCTTQGYTTYACIICSYSYRDNTVAATGHNYVGGVCSGCGDVKATVTEATISFSTTANRTVFNTSQQVWAQNGITVTNNKSASTVNVADYAKPARFYANSTLIIEAEGNITKIVFDCNSTAYATALANSIGSDASANGDKVTVTLDGNSDTFTITKLSAQVRIDSITVTYSEAGATPSCQHTNKTVDAAVSPTCTATGLTEGERCADCGEILAKQTTIDALGHDWIPADYENSKTCDRCGATEGEKLPTETTCQHTNKIIDAAVSPTCTATGLTEGERCADCGEILVAQTTIAALGHREAEAVKENELLPTCTENGSYDSVVYCTGCNAELERDTVTASALGHDWIPADYENPKTCSVCGVTEGEKLPTETPDTDETPDDETTDRDETTDEDEIPEIEKDHTKCEEEESGLQKLIRAILNFFRNLFGLPEECACGEEIE